MSTGTPWRAGQRATIDRQRVVTVERVTPAGRAVVDGRIFEIDGIERTSGRRRLKLELLTPEIQAEMDLIIGSQRVFGEAARLMDVAAKWLSAVYSPWRRRTEAEDVNRAEKLIVALREVMGETSDVQS